MASRLKKLGAQVKETLWGKSEDLSPDPSVLNMENAYKTRWVWYHTILGIELLIVILVQLAILVVLAVKL